MRRKDWGTGLVGKKQHYSIAEVNMIEISKQNDIYARDKRWLKSHANKN